jgi:HPt (histidine-containing phosphotransfer) domain-containing protein
MPIEYGKSAQFFKHTSTQEGANVNHMKYKHCNPEMLLETVGDDKEVFIELADIFLSESISKYASLQRAALTSDWKTLGYESHSLKGTVGPLGADVLFHLLETIEIECDQNNCICDQQRLSVINSELNHIRAEVGHFVNYLKSL